MTSTTPRPWLTHYPPEVPPQIGSLQFDSIPDLVDHTIERFGERPAFSNMGHTLTFTEVGELADAFATYFQRDLGLVKGDRIVIQMPNLLQFPIAVFGALKAGLVVVNANPLYTAPEVRTIINEAQARAIVVLANFAGTIASILGETTLEHVVVTGAADLFPAPRRAVMNVGMRLKRMIPAYDIPYVHHLREALRHRGHADFDRPELTPDDLALLQFTGGTTGTPKGAMLTHRNLMSNGAQMMAEMRAVFDEGEEVVLAALPLYHVFCMTVNCMCFFNFGFHNVLVTNPREVDALAKTIEKSRTSIMILVSTLAQALLDNERFQRTDFGFLKLAVSGGMALRDQTAREWMDLTRKPIIEGYGLTEASPVVSVNPPWLDPEVGTVGIPLPSTDVRIVADDGTPAPVGEAGDLQVRGPQVMLGYWQHQDETSRAIDADGWLTTGDIAVLREDGYLKIVDRRKDMISVSGFNVYPNEVEDVLASHPLVKAAGVIGVPDEHSGEAVKAFVVRTTDSLTEQELRAYTRKYLTGYKRPRSYEFREELPMSAVGKVVRRELRPDSDGGQHA